MEVRDRLARLRSFIWWSAPLYVLFVLAGLYASEFAFSAELGILLALLVAFGFLDGLALVQIRAIESVALASPEDLITSRARIDRLARYLTWGGAGFGVLFLAVFLALMLARFT